MRYAFSLLCLGATLVAQEPPVLVTSPPVPDTRFGPAALGVVEVSQYCITYNPTAQNFYITATVKNGATTFWSPWSGTATYGSPGNYTITPNGDVANIPPPTADYFAFNHSSDQLVLVFDSGPSTPVAVWVRSNTSQPFTQFGSVPSPVPVGYRDAAIGNTISSWNGSTGAYELLYLNGNNVMKVDMTLGPAAGQVTLGTPVTVVNATIAAHSQSPVRQYTGVPAEWGTARALMHSRNDSSADAFFRPTLDENVAAPSLLIYDDGNWKANPGNIGGSMFWAYATTTYSDPLLLDTVCMSSAVVPSAGGALTICAWAPPSTQTQIGFVMLGALQTPGINLSPLVTRGLLGLNPAGIVFLPAQVFDQNLGEISYSFVTGFLPRGTIDMQVGALNVSTNQIFLGNNAVIYIQ